MAISTTRSTVSRISHAQQGIDDLFLNLLVISWIHNAIRIPSFEVDKNMRMARFQRKGLGPGPVDHHLVGLIIKREVDQAGAGQMMFEVRVPLNSGKPMVRNNADERFIEVHILKNAADSLVDFGINPADVPRIFGASCSL